MLTGKFRAETQFEKDDHRNFNRNGEQFNVGETFAGLDVNQGVRLSRQLEWIAERRGNMTRGALRWILDHDSVTTVIPGFKTTQQVADNLAALEAASFSPSEMEKLSYFYWNSVHEHIRGAY